MSEHAIIIASDGSLSFLYDDSLADLCQCGHTEIRRASSVEPCPAGGWTADLSPSGHDVVLGPFPLRQQALDAEVKFLEERMAQ